MEEETNPEEREGVVGTQQPPESLADRKADCSTIMKMEEETNPEGRKVVEIMQTLDSLAVRKVNCNIMIVSFDNLLERFGNSQLRNLVHAGIHNPASQTFFVDASRLFSSAFDNHNKAFSKDELEVSNNLLTKMSNKFKDNPELVSHFSNWLKSRKELIAISESSAETLDKHLLTQNIARIIGSFVEILNSLDLGIYQKFCFIISSYAYNISSNLGFLIETALEIAPHLRYLGFMSSFFGNIYLQVVVNHVVKAMKKDKDLFKPLKKWFDETKEIDDTVKKLFPYGIDINITKSIERYVEDLKEEEKIFSAALLSNIIEDSTFHKNGKLLARVFLFCRSDAAKKWYKRMVTNAYPVNIECDMHYLRSELQELEGTNADPATVLELGKAPIQHSKNTANNTRTNFDRMAMSCMSGMSIYFCYKNIRAGSKHMYSDRLREFSENAQSFLNTMEKIRF